MENSLQLVILMVLAFTITSCVTKNDQEVLRQHQDKSFIQDYSVKYNGPEGKIKLIKVVSDRNGYIQIFSSKGLLRPRDGQFLFPGTLVTDVRDKQTSDKKIAAIGIYNDQLVYIDDKAVFSNAWAGKLFSMHNLPDARIFAGGKDFYFLVSDGKNLNFLKDSEKLWNGTLSGESIEDIRFDSANNLFWILGKESINTFSPETRKLIKIISGRNMTCIELTSAKLIVGTSDGYFELDLKTKKTDW